MTLKQLFRPAQVFAVALGAAVPTAGAQPWTRCGVAVLGGILLALAGCATPSPLALDPQSRADVARIEQYLNSVHTLRADFLQVAGNDISQGVAWMERPGRLRLDYDPPRQSVLLAADNQVTFYDAATEATTRMPLSRTPLAMLLAPQITLSGPVTITGFQHLPGEMRVTIVRTANPGQGALTLAFQDNPMTLRDVQMVDARGNQTRLVLRRLQIDVAVPANLFQLSPHASS